MGYRSRLGRVKKTERDKFMGLSHDEADETLEEYFDPNSARDAGALYRPYFHEQFIELGKYCQFDIAPEPFYDGFNIQEECEAEFHILTKQGLKQIIREYHKAVEEHYQELRTKMDSNDPNDIHDVKIFLSNRQREWDLEKSDSYAHVCEMSPYYLDSDDSKRDGFIARSWNYEYQVFNLSYIYSTFDWDNDYLIYSAW